MKDYKVELTQKELDYILTILKIHKKSYNEFLRGFGKANETDIFLDDLISKLEKL